MRRIEKGSPPECLTEWIRLQRPAGVNLNYGNFGEKATLLRVLIAEQHTLCGYTGVRVQPANSHVEHLKPQRACREELEASGGTFGRDLCDDLSYDNMIAAVTVKGKKPFGADAKKSWYDPSQFVSPLDADCETRFAFDLLGDIQPRNTDDKAAGKTIEVLKLDHPTLRDARRGMLEGFLPEDLLTREYLEEVVTVMDTPVNNALPEFSFVIKSVAEDLLRAIPA